MSFDAAYVRALMPQARTRLASLNQDTPLERVGLSAIANDVFLKREDLSHVRSYKWRGAFNNMMQLLQQKGPVPMVTASAGNHAQGVAWAADTLGVKAKIFMPVSTPQVKQDAVRRFGGDRVEMMLVGDTYNQASEAASRYAEASGAEYIHAFDNMYTIAGQATMAQEIVEATPAGMGYDVAFLQIGGGGMAAGVSSVLREAYPGIRLVGVEGKGQNCMQESFHRGDLVTLSQVDVVCDGTAVTRPGELCYSICRDNLDEIITVSNGGVHAAMRALWNAGRIVPEPSGAMGVAGMLKWCKDNPELAHGARILGVISGANMDFDRIGFLAAAEDEEDRHHLRLALREDSGSLLEVADRCFSNVDITAFQYGKVDHVQAWPVIGFKADQAQLEDIKTCLKGAGVGFEDVSGAVDAGNSIIPFNPALVSNPLMLEVDFPERKGALRELMRAVKPHANMCYFRYKASGDMRSKALMAFEFASRDGHAACMEAISRTPVTFRPVSDAVRDRMLYVANRPA